MSQGPRRLRDYGDDLNGVLRSALDAERADDVDAARLERIARSLSAATAAETATTHAHAASTKNAASTATKAGWLASKGPIIVLAAVSIGGLTTMRLRTSATQPIAPQRPETPMTVAPPSPPSPEPVTLSPADLPSAPVVTPALAVKATKPVTTAAAPSDGDEIALLARAHDALHEAPARSLALCKEHEKRWAAGQFAQEREAVAIEALVYLGRRDEAARRCTAFRERYPSSSHRVHLEGLLAAQPAQ